MPVISWNLAITPGAAFAAGILGVIYLMARGKHKVGGVVMPERVTAAAVLCFATYTLFVLMVANFFNLLPLSQSISKIGDDRVSILFMGITADLLGRYYRLIA